MVTVQTKKFIGKGLKETGPNRNVLNVLRLLIEDDNSIVYMPANYERGTRKRIDENVHHGHRYAPVAMPISNFVSNLDRFNFSVRGLKEVLVESQTGVMEPKKVFRTYNIIRDGELHIDKLEAKLSQEAYIELITAGVLYDQVGRKVDGEKTVYNPDYIYTIDMSELPLVSTHWANPTQLGFVDYLKEETYLTVLVKVLGQVERDWRSKLISSGAIEKVEDDIYIETSKYAEEESKGSYEVESVQYRVISDDVKSRVKIITQDDLESQYESYNEVVADLKHYRKVLASHRFIIRAVAFAIENTKEQGSKTFDFSAPEKLPRSKNKMVQRAELGEGEVLEKITWTQSIPL
jgi:hypothetical protein